MGLKSEQVSPILDPHVFHSSQQPKTLSPSETDGLPVRIFVINHRKINVQYLERLHCFEHNQLFSSVFPLSVLSLSFVALFLLLFHLHNHFGLPVRMFIINHRKINVQYFERLPCFEHNQLFSSVFFPFRYEHIFFCFCCYCYFICTTTLIIHVFAYMNQHINSFPAKALLPLVLFQFINGRQYTLSCIYLKMYTGIYTHDVPIKHEK